MPRSVKKVKIKKSKSRTTTIGSKNITQTVKISLGGGGKGGVLDSLYKHLQKDMGGPGQGSSPSYPSSPSYYRLLPPNQTFAQTPQALSGQNQAVPNNLVSRTLINPSHGSAGVATAKGVGAAQEIVRQERLKSEAFAKLGQRIVPSDPEPNRPISAVQSEMAAGRPILSDPSLPRQKPAGRDNTPQPTVAEVGAPDSGYFPQQAQAPISVAQEQALQREVGMTKISRPRRTRQLVEEEGEEEEEEEEQERGLPLTPLQQKAQEFSQLDLTKISDKKLRRMSGQIGVSEKVRGSHKPVALLRQEMTERIQEMLRGMGASSSSSSSSGAF